MLNLSTYFLSTLRHALSTHRISPTLISLPGHLSSPSSSVQNPSVPDIATPIIPVLTPHPRPLSAHLRVRGLNARPITWPTVPKGADRIRVCLHAHNTREGVDRLVSAMVEWAESWEAAQGSAGGARASEGVGSVQAKL